MLDNIWTLLPYFDAGIVAAVVARFTGMNLSMTVLFALLYIGATPVEAVMSMLVFNPFTYFTVYTQQHILGIKDLTFFPGAKMLIPVIVTLALATFNPFVGIIIFIALFLAESFAKVYKAMDVKKRPSARHIVFMTLGASVLMIIGLVLVQWFPEKYYYILAGAAALVFVIIMAVSSNRRAYTGMWDYLMYGSAFISGLTGIIADDWFGAMKRQKESALSQVYPIVMYSAAVITLLAGYGVYSYFSAGSLFLTIGAALTIRFLGVYDYGKSGKFSYLALGMTVLVILIFWLIQPVPTGLPEIADKATSLF